MQASRRAAPPSQSPVEASAPDPTARTAGARAVLLDDLMRRLALIGYDELRVIERVAERLDLGRHRYGELDLSRPRAWRRELREELLDALVYDVAEELAFEDRMRARLREETAAEMLGTGDGE
jgi:hypothetical protein